MENMRVAKMIAVSIILLVGFVFGIIILAIVKESHIVMMIGGCLLVIGGIMGLTTRKPQKAQIISPKLIPSIILIGIALFAAGFRGYSF